MKKLLLLLLLPLFFIQTSSQPTGVTGIQPTEHPIIEPISLQLEPKEELSKIQVYTPRRDSPIVPSKPVESNTYHKLINDYRASHGLNRLWWHNGLKTSAQLKSEDLVNRNYWSHDTPDGQAFHVLVYQHGSYINVGENLAKGFKSADAVMQGWINSPAHNANVLDSRWIHIGVGEYNGHITTHFSN